MYRIRFSAALIAAAALMAAACSDNPTRLSQTGPSAISTSNTAGSETNGASSFIDRTTGVVRDSGTVSTWARQRGWAMADGLTVEGTDVITAVTGTCPDRVTTIRGVPVTVNAATTFGTGITCETLAVDLTVKVTGLLTFAEGTFSVVATRIEPPPSTTPVVVEVTGIVAGFAGACPSLTITLQGTGGVVLTSSTTVFSPADSCGQIASGRTITAKGTRNTSGHLVASDVTVAPAPTPTHGRKLSGEGTVELVTGTCPVVTVTVRGVAVRTSDATVYVGGTCADLAEGTKVSIDAETQTDESLLATTVRIVSKPGGHRVAGEGTVNHVTGACPVVSLNVQGYTVNISSATVFTGGTCGSLRNGVKIAATGLLVGTTMTAEAVTIKSTSKRDE